jgi:hypothetical protein
MTRTAAPAPGVEEWSCTQCARRLRIRRPPEFEKIVLAPGDESAAHLGGTGGLQLTPVTASPASAGRLAAQDRDWLAAHGINWEPPLPGGRQAGPPPS